MGGRHQSKSRTHNALPVTANPLQRLITKNTPSEPRTHFQNVLSTQTPVPLCPSRASQMRTKDASSGLRPRHRGCPENKKGKLQEDPAVQLEGNTRTCSDCSPLSPSAHTSTSILTWFLFSLALRNIFRIYF